MVRRRVMSREGRKRGEEEYLEKKVREEERNV